MMKATISQYPNPTTYPKIPYSMSTHGTMLNAPMIPPIPTSDISLTNIFKRTWQIDCFHFGTHTYYARLQGIRVRMRLYILTVCKKTQGFVGFNPLGSEEANISKTETE